MTERRNDEPGWMAFARAEDVELPEVARDIRKGDIGSGNDQLTRVYSMERVVKNV